MNRFAPLSIDSAAAAVELANATRGNEIAGSRGDPERFPLHGGPAMSRSGGESVKEGAAVRRILVVEDEFLIRMLLEDMLDELGYGVAGVAGRVDEAADIAKTGEYDLAILDVNLDGEDVYPVAEIIAARGVPFVFVTGYGGRGLPEAFRNRPTLQKPFQIDDLGRTLGSFFEAE